MARKQTFKDRNRDPNPSNPPPDAQVREQKLKRRKPVSKPTAQKASRPKKKAAPRKVVAAKTPAKRRDVNPLLRVTDTQSGTIHEEARRQKIRQTAATSPTDTVTVEGRKVQVVARPEQLAPEIIPAHKRDTLIKDRLRETSVHEDTVKADAPVLEPVGGDWHTEVAKAEGKERGKVGSAR